MRMLITTLIPLSNVPGQVAPLPVGTIGEVDRVHDDESVTVWFDGIRFPITLAAGEYAVEG